MYFAGWEGAPHALVACFCFFGTHAHFPCYVCAMLAALATISDEDDMSRPTAKRSTDKAELGKPLLAPTGACGATAFFFVARGAQTHKSSLPLVGVALHCVPVVGDGPSPPSSPSTAPISSPL